MSSITDNNYNSLKEVLDAALQQAASGKGKERHNKHDEPFEKQRMQTISILLYSNKGMAFQAIKKLTEGLEMEDTQDQEKELLGAINYIAGIIIWNKTRY